MQELGVRDTDALMTLWRERQNGTLAAEGVEALRRLLLDRVGFLPSDPAGAKAPSALQGAVRGSEARPTDRSDRDSLVPPRRLRQILAGAQAFSWVYLASGLIAAAVQALQAFSTGDWSGIGFNLLSTVLTALQAVFFFLVLQVMAEGLLLALGMPGRRRRAS